MQEELRVAGWSIDLLGINAIGEEDGNMLIVQEGDLPWLQDDSANEVWEGWEAVWRDFYVLDGENRVVAIYNLTEHPLEDPDNYDELAALLRDTDP